MAATATTREPRTGGSELLAATAFLSPLILLLTVLVLQPVVGTVADSFRRDIVFLKPAFAGVSNYTALLDDPGFWSAARFTLLFALVSVPLEVAIGLAIALLLNEPLPFRGLCRACVLIPWSIPAAVSGRVFQLIYDYSNGAANWILQATGLAAAPVNWLGTSMGAFSGVVAADVWKTAPFAAVMLLAGLSAIPEVLYQQAAVDRAGPWQRFVYITLPQLKPVLVVTLLFRTIQAVCIFDVIFVLTGGGPGAATQSLSVLAYSYFGSGDFGYGSAVSALLFALALLLATLYVRSTRNSARNGTWRRA
jgi:multiple sugar transport system permease protein